jgi:hypothetical protein
MTRRARRRVEAVLALLAFPIAVATTIVVISSPVSSRPAPKPTAAVGGTVQVSGGGALPAYGLADRLAAAGYEVVAVRPGDNSVGPETVVVYYERGDRAVAERLRDLLGTGTIRREQVLSPSSDLTILLGKDLQHT